MNTQEALNRGVNILGVSITGIAGLAFAPEAILENDMPDKLDDALLFILALVAIGWYARSSNRLVRSVMPVAFIVIALLIKIMGVIIEHGDPDALGDDMGGLILFVCATALIAYQYVKTKKFLVAQV